LVGVVGLKLRRLPHILLVPETEEIGIGKPPFSAVGFSVVQKGKVSWQEIDYARLAL
jgi:hypothetical protein